MPKGIPRFPAMRDAERAILGCMVRNSDFRDKALTELTTDDFYYSDTASVFSGFTSLSSAGLTCSPAAVAEHSAKPLVYIRELVEESSGTTDKQLETLIQEVLRVSTLRKTYALCKDVAGSINKDSSVETVLQTLETGLYKQDRKGIEDAIDGSEVMRDAVAEVLAKAAGEGPKAISTGLKELDRAILGLQPGRVFVIAARPGMGKSALADTIRRAVTAQGYGAIQFSLEMSKEEIMEREIAYQSQTNLRKIISGSDMSSDSLARVGDLASSILPGRWYIDDRSFSISAIRRRARILSGRMQRQGIQLGIVVLDYIQLAGDNGEHREQSVASISRGCKQMAKELGCTVVALSQLNRSCDNREDRRPLMSDLRESGAIEQDADIVGFVYREHCYDESVPPEEAEFIIRKHRSGPTGTVRLAYNPKLVCFSDLAYLHVQG